jgi:hypothetical protein
VTEEQVRHEILNAIIDCTEQGEPVVSRVDDVRRLREAIFQALSQKHLLKIEPPMNDIAPE